MLLSTLGAGLLRNMLTGKTKITRPGEISAGQVMIKACQGL